MTYIPFSWQSGSVLLRQQSRENIEGAELGVSIAHAAVILNAGFIVTSYITNVLTAVTRRS